MVHIASILSKNGVKVVLLLIMWGLMTTAAQAQTTNCTQPFLIDRQLPNGARWSMCWEWKAQEGIVFHDITFTTPTGIERLVLKEAAAAELHVNYDNGSVAFFDLSREGLGINLEDLLADDCPNGTLHPHDIGNGTVRNVLCEMIHEDGFAWKRDQRRAYAAALDLFSVSKISAYEYIYKWSFHDDGTISIGVGATGQLEEIGWGAEGYGWDTTADPDDRIIALSHVHNYWFRLDFDIGGAEHDTVEEFNFDLRDSNGLRRLMSITETVTETARTVSPETYRLWRVKDTEIINADGHAVSYRLEPTTQGIYSDPGYEPWSNHELYITQYKPCEQWLVNNPAVNGCGETVLDYVDGENVADTDVVLWYGMSFHHLTRDEDEPYMQIHWEEFHLVPHDWTFENPNVNVTPQAPSSVLTVDGQGDARVTAVWGQATLLILIASFAVNIVFIRRMVDKRQ